MAAAGTIRSFRGIGGKSTATAAPPRLAVEIPRVYADFTLHDE